MNILTRILNWFRSNKTLAKIAVQETAFAVVKRRPAFKPIVARATMATAQLASAGKINGVFDLSKTLNAQIAAEIKKLPPEQQMLLADSAQFLAEDLGSALSTAVYTWIGKTAPGPEQVKGLLEVLGWVQDAANMVPEVSK